MQWRTILRGFCLFAAAASVVAGCNRAARVDRANAPAPLLPIAGFHSRAGERVEGPELTAPVGGAAGDAPVAAPAPSEAPTSEKPAAPEATLPAKGDTAPAPQPGKVTLLTEVPLGPRDYWAGVTAAAPGGDSPAGPRALAAEPGGTLYLLDSTRNRVLSYREGRATGVIDLPFAGDAYDLHWEQGSLTVTTPAATYGVSSAGQLLETQPAEAAEPVPVPAAGRPALIGTDAAGRRYELALNGQGQVVVSRFSAAGAVLAAAMAPGETAADWWVAADGAVYLLTWHQPEGAQVPTAARVYQVLEPDGASQTGAAKPPAPGAGGTAGPLAALGVPAKLELRSPVWLPVEVSDGATLQNVAVLLGKLQPVPGLTHRSGKPALQMKVQLSQGKTVQAEVSPAGLTLAGAAYSHPVHSGDLYELLTGQLYQPGLLVQAFTAGPGTVSSPDLPGRENQVTSRDLKLLAVLLQRAFPVAPGEVPRYPEPPFPTYEVRVQGAGWEARLRPAAEQYFYLNDLVFAYPGGLQDLLGHWLPAPAFSSQTPEGLFRAERLMVVAAGQKTDLSQRLPTVLRYLSGALTVPKVDLQYDYRPRQLVFKQGDQEVTVNLQADSFSLGGQTYSRPGIGAAVLGLLPAP